LVEQSNLRELSNTVQNIKNEVDKLKTLGGNFKFIEMNIIRMSAMIKMLELGINDVKDVLGS